MKLKRYLLAGITLFIMLFAGTVCINASEESLVVRVGYPIQNGLTGKDEDGRYSGYTYEYLQMISQYTGFEYEFIEVPGDENEQIMTLLEMLENGEIDVLGSMAYDESMAEIFDYAVNTYGSYERGLYVLRDNMEFNMTSIYSMDNVRVAIHGNKTSTATQKLERYMQGLDIGIEEIFVDTVDEQIEALRNKTADVLLANTLNAPLSEVRCIARFDAQPIYFAVAKGKGELCSKINEAVTAIHTANPYYATSLMQKYFYNTSQMVQLTEEEKAYIQEVSTLRVLLVGGAAPIEYVDANGQPKGIVVNVLEHIRQQSGLELDIVIANDMQEYEEAILAGKPDLIITDSVMDEELDISENYRISMPFIAAPVSLVVNNTTNMEDWDEGEIPLDTDTGCGKRNKVEVCLRSVNEGKTEYTYVNSYSVEYYKNKLHLENIYSYQYETETTNYYSVGISKSLGIPMLSVINKCIHNIPQEELFESYLYQIQEDNATFGEYIRANKVEFVFCMVVLVALIVIIGLLCKFNIERKNKERIIEQAKRDGMTGLYMTSSFREIVNEKISGAKEDRMKALIMVDVDHFKLVNDTYGHYIGDKVLQGFAAYAKEVFCEGEIIGRVGGDEFAVYAEGDISSDSLSEKCRQIKIKMKQLSVMEGKTEITLSMGGVMAMGVTDYEQMFRMADEVMYEVKRNGRDGFKIREIVEKEEQKTEGKESSVHQV